MKSSLYSAHNQRKVTFMVTLCHLIGQTLVFFHISDGKSNS